MSSRRDSRGHHRRRTFLWFVVCAAGTGAATVVYSSLLRVASTVDDGKHAGRAAPSGRTIQAVRESVPRMLAATAAEVPAIVAARPPAPTRPAAPAPVVQAAPAVPACGTARGVPLAGLARSPGRASELCAGLTGGSTLRGAGSVVVRVLLRSPGDAQFFVDADESRDTGMWSYQSATSSSGWDVLVDGSGVYRHAGRPNEWRWRRVASASVERTSGSVTAHIPVGTIDPAAARVRLAANASGSWVPGPFMPGAPFPGNDVQPPPAAGDPGRLAIFYSAQPWVVRNCDGPVLLGRGCPVDVFGKFGDVVFAGGLEQAAHTSHGRTALTIRDLALDRPGTRTWGYVSAIGEADVGGDGRRDAIYTPDDIRAHAAMWKASGVAGIFLDEVGVCEPEWQDCPVGPDGREASRTKEHLRTSIDAVHELGLAVFANAYAMLDVFGSLDGASSPLGGPADGRPADAYLIENPTIASGRARADLDAEVSAAKYWLAPRLARATHARIAAVDTASGWVEDDAVSSDFYRRAWSAAAVAGVDGYGYTNGSFSAAPSVMRNLAILGRPTRGLLADSRTASSPASDRLIVRARAGGCTTAVCEASLRARAIG